MIIYLIKTILCLALLLLVYHLFLEKEKMHRFNRFYLLFSIVASFGLPFIQLPAQVQTIPVVDNKITFDISLFNSIEYATDEPALLIRAAPENRPWWPALLIVLYVGVSLILLFRFVRNVVMLAAIIKDSSTVIYSGARLVLTNNQRVPHSFLHYIFLPKTDYENGLVEKEILLHELTHVQQKHSLDILFIEALLIFFWFNPALYLYRRAIQFNHEFLADDAVVEAFQNPVNYQQLLLLYTSRPGSILPTSPFNFSITKKRLIMMTRKTSPKIALAKQIAMLPFLTAMVLIFSTKVTGQQNTGKPGVPQDTAKSKQQQRQIEASKEDAPLVIIEHYASILSKYNLNTKEGRENFGSIVTQSDREQLEYLYTKMSKEQQSKQIVIFMPSFSPAVRNAPTTIQFNNFKNPKIYGVWINNKKIMNTVLNKYEATDFVLFDVSKLYGAAKTNKIYSY